jgi:hypothetical protein
MSDAVAHFDSKFGHGAWPGLFLGLFLSFDLQVRITVCLPVNWKASLSLLLVTSLLADSSFNARY